VASPCRRRRATRRSLRAGTAADAAALVDLADLYRAQTRFADAERLFTRAIALIERLHGVTAAELARPLNGLALVLRAQGHYDRAEPLCERALAITERAHGPDHPATVRVLGNLLTVYLAQGRYGEAGPLFQRSVTSKERLLGPHHPELASSFSTYAAFLRKTQGESAAAAWEARARAITGAGHG
jgi:tetratricopeptide (TPR) repeat protein